MLKAPGEEPLPGQAASSTPSTPGQASALALCRQLQDQWKQGRPVPVEQFLDLHPDLRANEQTVLDCIYSEFVVRQEQGESPEPGEYYRRFPLYESQLRRLFDLDGALQFQTPSPNDPLGLAGTIQQAPAGDTAPPQPSAATPPGGVPEVIGKYRVISRFGAGGQGSVFRAVHPDLGHDVVIKLANDRWDLSDEERGSLLAEGRILLELGHPNLARVYDFDFHEGRPFLVMEFVRGRTLDQYARDCQPTPRQAAGLVAQVARALAAVHRRGILHRDLKPQNILIDDAGKPRVIDFGLARRRHAWAEDVEEPGTVAGTLQFMAPEQARGETEQVGPWTDVFALGGILYCLLTGLPPWEGQDMVDLILRARRGEVDFGPLQKPGIPGKLRAVCRRALAADPRDRPASADQLAADLEGCAGGSRRVRKWAVLALAGLLSFGVLAWLLGAFTTAPPDPVDNSPKPDTKGKPAPVVAEKEDPRPTLFVEAWDRDRYRGLAIVAPLRSGKLVRVWAQAPADLHVSLFLFTSEGKLKLLGQRGPQEGALRFPPEEGKAVPLEGQAGTEFLLACGRREGPISVDDVLAAWGKTGHWPNLPGQSVLRLQRGGVTVEQRDRDFGTAKEQADPEGDVQRLLEGLRLGLRPRFAYFEGLAFAHK